MPSTVFVYTLPEGISFNNVTEGGLYDEKRNQLGTYSVSKVDNRDVLRINYYDEKFGDGFAFAYRFPGWEKVLQAVGRVIRTENDTGFALLIDDRLERPEYISLYPENWRV